MAAAVRAVLSILSVAPPKHRSQLWPFVEFPRRLWIWGGPLSGSKELEDWSTGNKGHAIAGVPGRLCFARFKDPQLLLALCTIQVPPYGEPVDRDRAGS